MRSQTPDWKLLYELAESIRRLQEEELAYHKGQYSVTEKGYDDRGGEE